MDENTAKLIKDLIKENPGVQINIGGSDIAYNKIIVEGKKEDTFPVEDIFNKAAGGIGDRSQFWLLLVAACARGVVFKDIPDFVDKSFATWENIPFDRDECLASTQEILKSASWTGINSQQKMIEFIKTKYSQTTKKQRCLTIANHLFIALKENPWGKT